MSEGAGRASLIRAATPNLKLRSIVLHSSLFERPTSPDSDEVEVVQQHRREISYASGHEMEGDTRIDLLQVRVLLGTRVVADPGEPGDEEARQEADQEGPVYFRVEAEFMAEYRILDEVAPEALRAFAEFNAVHNIWPFWRQHVFDIVQRGELPKLEVPFFAGLDL
jgi:hypothetical protein